MIRYKLVSVVGQSVSVIRFYLLAFYFNFFSKRLCKFSSPTCCNQGSQAIVSISRRLNTACVAQLPVYCKLGNSNLVLYCRHIYRHTDWSVLRYDEAIRSDHRWRRVHHYFTDSVQWYAAADTRAGSPGQVQCRLHQWIHLHYQSVQPCQRGT